MREREVQVCQYESSSCSFSCLMIVQYGLQSTFCALCCVVESVEFICDLSLLTVLAEEAEGYTGS